MDPEERQAYCEAHSISPDELDGWFAACDGGIPGEAMDDAPLRDLLTAVPLATVDDLRAVLERQQSMPATRLGAILIQAGVLSEEQLQQALRLQREGNTKPLGEILMELGNVSREVIHKSVARELGIPYVDLMDYRIDTGLLSLLPEDVVRRHGILPLATVGGRLVVAMNNPFDHEAIQTLRFQTRMRVEPVLADAEDIEHLINLAYAKGGGLDQLHLDRVAAFQPVAEELDSVRDDAYQDNVIVRFVNKLIQDAYWQGASDIHIEPIPQRHKTLIRFRKDGTLLRYFEVPSTVSDAVVGRIKVMCELDVAERRLPQDGKIDFSRFSPLRLELRVSTMPTVGGQEDVVMRLLAGGEPIPVEKLGLTDANRERLLAMINKPYGLLLVCGPTGSGKTTTLHSVLRVLNTTERKIWTAEDPVEITQQGLRQVQVRPKIGLDFARAMRGFLRLDPDVIMVGEMRDRETITIAIEASLTGHMVFSTLHTNSAPESVTRLLEMGMDPFNFSDALVGVLAQRLTKRLCPHCRRSEVAGEEEIEALLDEYCYELAAVRGVDSVQVKDETRKDWYRRFGDAQGHIVLNRPVGCRECDETGYRGRIGIHELLEATGSAKRLIREKAPVTAILSNALSDGMRTLRQDGIEKVLQGLTDIVQVRRVCAR